VSGARTLSGALASLLLMAGCGSSLPDPSVVGVSPQTMLASEAREVVVRLEGILPFSVDYNQGTATADPATRLRIGGQEFASSGYRADGTLSAFIPSVLSEGTYDVEVRLADERTGTAAGAFTVTPGNWPDQYQFEGTIPEQVVGQPFAVTIRALKEGVTFPSFTGTARLTGNRPEFVPLITQPFDAGLVTERTVTIPYAGPATLTVTDTNGTTATSNSFLVRAP